jgi:hypothetical protein
MVFRPSVTEVTWVEHQSELLEHYQVLLVLSERLVGMVVAGVDNTVEKGQLDKQSHHQRQFISSWVGETF